MILLKQALQNRGGGRGQDRGGDSLPKSCDIFADEPYKTKIYMKINKQNHEQVKIQLNRLKEVRLCLILATFKEQVDKLNLVELGN